MVKIFVDTLGIVQATDEGTLVFENNSEPYKEVRELMQDYYDFNKLNGHSSQTELLINGAINAFGIDRSETSIIIPETAPQETYFDEELNLENKIVE